MSGQSFRQKVGSTIAGKPQTPFNEAALTKIGAQTISTERVAERRQSLKEFHALLDIRPPLDVKDKPDELFEWLVDSMYDVWHMYKENQVAWARAGSNGDLATMVTAINTMKVQTEIAIEANRNILSRYNDALKVATEKKDTSTESKIKSKKMQVVREFKEAWLIKNVFEYVEKMGDLCWFIEDVDTPITVAVMSNQPIQPGMGDTLTGSGGRTSEDNNQVRHPKGGPYPERQKNTVE